MEVADEKLCPFCAGLLSANDSVCIHCGRNLNCDPFQIVCDGLNFGISLKGCIVLNGLNLKQGQELIAVMNGR